MSRSPALDAPLPLPWRQRGAVAGALTAAIVVGGVAFGQEESRRELEEIVVTAQRREQSLQKVPISITAFSAESIAANQIESLEDYFLLTPNVNFSNNGNRARNQLSIRGVGNIGGRANAFGVYVDGFNIAPTASTRTFDPNLIDVETIEILRGPQGTFFGRNSTAGAINITSKKPSQEVGANIDAEYSRYDSALVRGSINYPILEDTLSARVSAFYQHTDGFIENIGPAGGRSDLDAYGARLALRWTPLDDLIVDFSARFSDYDYGANAVVARDPETLGIPGAPYTIDTNRPNFADLYGPVLTLTAQYDLGFAILRSITGYVDNTYREFADGDGAPEDLLFQDAKTGLDSWSEELQLETELFDRVELIAGAIYAEDRLTTDFERVLAGDGVVLLGLDGTERTRSWAIYADGTWRIFSRFDLTIGGRFTYSDYERRDVEVGLGQMRENPGISQDDNDFSPRFVGTFYWTDQILTYGSISKGFKIGGANDFVPEGGNESFDKEDLWNFEVGAKLDLFDRRLRINTAGFYVDWTDLQVFADADPFSPIPLTFVQNAAEASSLGFELEAAAIPITGAMLTGGVGYLDAKFDSFDNAISGGERVDLSGDRVPFAPQWTLNATGQYTRALTDWLDVFLRAEWSFVDEVHRNPDTQYLLEERGDRTFIIPRYDVTNLRLGFSTERVRVTAYAENLFNEDYFTGIRGTTLVDPHPRIFGVRVHLDLES